MFVEKYSALLPLYAESGQGLGAVSVAPESVRVFHRGVVINW